MEYEKIIIRLVDWMPPSVTELVVKSCDCGEDYFTIFLNQKASSERLVAAYHHAMKHIEKGDLNSSDDVQMIEAMRHAG